VRRNIKDFLFSYFLPLSFPEHETEDNVQSKSLIHGKDLGPTRKISTLVATSAHSQNNPLILLCSRALVMLWDDIDSFLTPDVLSRRQSNERTSLDDPDDGETGYEDEQCIQLPPQHYVDSIHQRDRPIPVDAELIILDDSDDDEAQGSRRRTELPHSLILMNCNTPMKNGGGGIKIQDR